MVIVAIRGTLVVMLTLRVIGWCNLRRGDKRTGATWGHGVVWGNMGHRRRDDITNFISLVNAWIPGFEILLRLRAVRWVRK